MHDTASKHVVIVDDNELASELLAEFLEQLGCAVRVAANGERALALCAARMPDILVVDIVLPDIDGYELAARVRATPGSQPRIIVLSGLPKSMQRNETELFDVWLEKPVDLDTLEQLVAHDTGRSRGAA